MQRDKEKKPFNKKRAALMAAALIAAGGIGVGGTAAFYSAQSKTAKNDFSVVAGKQKDDTGDDSSKGGALIVDEDKWDKTDDDKDGIPDKAENLQPGGSVEKNPVIESNVSYPGYIVVKVSVPKLHARMTEDEKELHYYPAFELENVSNQFTLIQTDNAGTDKGGTTDYYYAYNKALDAHEKTPELFTSLKEPDFREVEAAKKDSRGIGTVDGSVDLKGAVVQTTGYHNPSDKTGGADTFKALYDALNNAE